MRLQEKDIIQIVKDDPWMMGVLTITRDTLNLSSWYIGAGFIRNKVWDHLHFYTHRTTLSDIDVAYFDPNDISEKSEKNLQETLIQKAPKIPWSVKNQVRMCLVNGEPPYLSLEDAISKWPETATCLGIRLENNNQLTFFTPHGIDDLVNLVVRESPNFPGKKSVYQYRVETKEWRKKWPNLTIIES